MLTLTTGDTGTIEGTVDANLTGATARVNIKAPDHTVITKTATVGDPVAGEWSITYASPNFALPGAYYLEVEVTFSSGAIQTFYKNSTGARLSLFVRRQIA